VLYTFTIDTICTIYAGLVQSRLCTADYALLTRYHGSLKHLNSRTHDRLKLPSRMAFYFLEGSETDVPGTVRVDKGWQAQSDLRFALAETAQATDRLGSGICLLFV
jgi:hypothetical protein